MFGVQCVSACICIRMFVLCVYECFDFFLNLFCIQVVEMNQLDTFIEYSTLLLCHFNTLVIVAIVLFCMSEYNMTIIHIIEKIRHVHLNKIVSQIEFLFKYSIKYKSNTCSTFNKQVHRLFFYQLFIDLFYPLLSLIIANVPISMRKMENCQHLVYIL